MRIKSLGKVLEEKKEIEEERKKLISLTEYKTL